MRRKDSAPEPSGQSDTEPGLELHGGDARVIDAAEYPVYVIAMAQKLDTGDTFPSMTLALAGGDTVTIPEDINSGYAIVLFYRGHW